MERTDRHPDPDHATQASPCGPTLTDADRARLRRRLADRIRSGDIPVDPDAVDELDRFGWARPLPDRAERGSL